MPFRKSFVAHVHGQSLNLLGVNAAVGPPAESVHCPIEAPASYVEPYLHLDPNRQTFAGMLAALDEAVGIVVGAFEKKEMWDNTLTVFSTVSDQTQLRLRLCR